MQLMVYFLGGLAFLFLGMDRLSEGLSGTFAPRRGQISAAGGFLTGLVWTSAVQSSSAVTTCLVSMTQAGIFTAADCFPMLLGANVGTTITVWLFSGLRVVKLQWSGLIPAVAALLLRRKKPAASKALMGLSLVLVGMELLQLAAEPFQAMVPLLDTPAAAFFSGLLLTAVIQSSAVTIGGLQGLEGILLPSAGAAVLGANIGTCVTGLLASAMLGKAGRTTARMELGINVVCAILMLPVVLLLPQQQTSPVQIAALHSLFNALTAAILLPATPLLRRQEQARACVRGNAEAC